MMISESGRNLIYVDESSHTKHRYLLQGGIIIPSETINEIEAWFSEFRDRENMHAELKWERVTRQKYAEYLRFVDEFFRLNFVDKLHFKALIVDTHKVNNRIYNAGDRDLGFFKFYYQLLLHSFGRDYGDKHLHILMDQKDTSQSLDQFKDILNNGIAKRYSVRTRPFKRIEFVNSKEHALSQMTDVILGALAYRKNGGHNVPGTREAKQNLTKYILERANITADVADSWRGQKRFSVWNFKFADKKNVRRASLPR